MITHIFTIFDNKAKVYGTPFFQINQDIAIRSAQDLVNDPQTTVHNHPEDFTLCSLGTYDDNSGITTPHGPKHVLNFNELFKKESIPHFSTDEIPQMPAFNGAN